MLGLFVWGKVLVQEAVQQPPEEATDEAPIFDETSPEQLQRETAVAEGRNPDAEQPAAPETPEAPVTPEPETAPAATQEKPPAEAPATPQPRVYSQGELDAIQDQWRQRYRGQQRAAEEARQRLSALNLEAQVEAHLRSEETRLAAQMGEAEARAFVRSPERAGQVRDHYQAQYQLREVQQREAARDVEQEQQAKVITARHLMQTYNVSDDDGELLLAASTPEGMEKTAKRLGRVREDKAREKAAIKAAVPAETRETALESGISGHSAPENDDARIKRLNETPSFEWGDDDIKFMRRLAS